MKPVTDYTQNYQREWKQRINIMGTVVITNFTLPEIRTTIRNPIKIWEKNTPP